MILQLSDHYTLGRLTRYTLPSIIMLIFTSIYTVVDGFFVSNFVGKEAFTALNFIYPFPQLLSCFGYMFGAGASALIAKTYGQGNPKKANEIFSFITYFSIGFGILLTIIGLLFLKPVAIWMGAEGLLLENSLIYGTVCIIALPVLMLQVQFFCWFPTAQKPKLGLYVTIAAGITNVVLDALFILVFKWGLLGAALATATSQIVGGVVPLIYFCFKNSSILHLRRGPWDWKSLTKTFTNGSSELMTNVSAAIVSALYMTQLLNYSGADGVAAYGVLMYFSFIFMSVYYGFTTGCAPIISYHYGAENHEELKNLFRLNLIFIFLSSILMVTLSELLARPLSSIFVGYDEGLFRLTVHAFRIYSISFLLSGWSVLGSGFFTALNNGLVSATISFLRTLVFQVSMIFLLPKIWGVDGIWFSLIVAEFLSALVSAFFFIIEKKRYQY